MRIKRAVASVLMSALVLTACVPAVDRKDAEDATGVKIEEEDGEEYFVFQDMKEETYRAGLSESVPKNNYDFTNFTIDDETGYGFYRDPQRGTTSKIGIDVSEFQGEDIDWKAVKDSGIEFVILRLGYRAYGESGDLVLDAMFEKNIKGAMDAGLEVGVYFFSQAVSPGEAVEEADFVLEHISPYRITGPVVYDTEEIEDDASRTDENTREEFTNYCKIFCDGIEQEGYDVMIYTNLKWMAFTLKMEELTEYDFWYADYHELPQCPYSYKIWQYSESGTVPGINSNVNLNIWFQEEEE